MSSRARQSTRTDRPGPLRAVIYTRVSSDPTARARSVGEQEAECRATCDEQGWQVVEPVVSDNDVSASRYARKARPQYAVLLEVLASGAADVVVFWEASRASRDMLVSVTLADLCQRHGVLVSYNGGRTLDMADPSDRERFMNDAASSERQSGETRKRVLRAVRAQAAAGLPHGRLLYGYVREYDQRGAFVAQVEHPEQAAVVREAARRVLAGESLTAVAVDLTSRGVPTPGPGADGSTTGRWHATTVRRLLLNPGYAGLRVHDGQVVGPAVWPAVISEADHRRLVGLLTDPARLARRGTSSEVRHLLSGIATCGRCGGPLRVLPNRGTVSYCCHTRGCFAVSRAQAPVDRHVTGRVLLALDDPRMLAALAAAQGTDEALSAAQDEAATLRGRLSEAEAEAAAGRMSVALLARLEARLQPEIDAAEARARRTALPASLEHLVGSGDLLAAWTALPMTGKRELLRLLVVPVVLPVGKRTRRFSADDLRLDWTVGMSPPVTT